MTVDVEVISLEQYLNQHGAFFMQGAEPAMHRTPGGFGKGQREKHLERVQLEMKENNDRRAQLSDEYNDKVRLGLIRPPTRIERLIATANGHEDNESVQAARRILARDNIEWKQS